MKSIFKKRWVWLACGAVALLVVAGIAGGKSAPHARTASGSQDTATGATPPTTQAPPVSSPSVPAASPPTTVSAAPATSSGLQYGPGPQATYTVQSQPPPGSCHYTYDGSDPLPDPHCTPGALNPQVTQSTIGSTICRSGYTSSIRPPESITEPEKQQSASSYGYKGSFSTGEYDHLVPLELGGDPNDAANLWVEPNDNPNATSTSNSKDVLENRLNSLVCSGQLSLGAAQAAIASNWATAYRTYVGSQSSSAPPSSTSPPPSGGDSCTASAAPANDGYSGDYYVTINSNQPNQKATASDAGDSWSASTNSSGYVRILLYHTSSGEQINVTVGSASCSTTA